MVEYLEHNIDLFSQRVGIDQCQLEGNRVGVEEGAGLHVPTATTLCSYDFLRQQQDLIMSFNIIFKMF